ncbi:MAG TPA: calcium/proton exchanger [Candidatus Paceibacterota bacterium]|nr:calcium/proton exchanger [Candidatus Paceibacterota bacterium]
MEALFLALLAFVPIAIGAHAFSVSPVVVFFLAALAVVPLAKFIGESTEELATHAGPALGGLLSVTFGNATELIIGFLALRAGLIEVVKASIAGSIMSNLLLVLGLAMLAGGVRHTKQTFNRTGALASGSNLFVAAIALVMPAIFLVTAPTASTGVVENMSLWVSLMLLLVYAAGLYFVLHTHKHLYLEEAGEFEPRASWQSALIKLVIATVLVAWVSEILVDSIQPTVAHFGWSQLFVGVIFLAIIGNAAENFSSIIVARKNRMDLSLQIAIGSATQIAMFVAPALVFAGFFMGQPMNLIFNTFELVAIVLSVLVVNLVVADGESNWLEGAQLIAAYAIMGAAFFFHP